MGEWHEGYVASLKGKPPSTREMLSPLQAQELYLGHNLNFTPKYLMTGRIHLASKGQ